MLEALWTVEFLSNAQAFGTGVAVFETGRVFGGDEQYYYLGTFKVEAGALTGEIEVTHFHGPGHSVFGPAARFNLRLSGKVQSPTMELHGNVVESPERLIVMRLTRRESLP